MLKLINEIADVHLKIEKLLEYLNQKKCGTLPSNSDFEWHSGLQERIFPLATMDQICDLEKKLDDENYFRRTKMKLSNMIGVQFAPGTGLNTAYQLIDHVFTREVLTNYTWTGVSSCEDGGRGHKSTFGRFVNVVQLFYEVVSQSDNIYSLKDNINFFQYKILKYAKQRAASNQKKKRVSTARHVMNRNKNNELKVSTKLFDPAKDVQSNL